MSHVKIFLKTFLHHRPEHFYWTVCESYLNVNIFQYLVFLN